MVEKICLSGFNQIKGLSQVPPSLSKLFNLHFHTKFNSGKLYSKKGRKRQRSSGGEEDSVESLSYLLHILLMYFDIVIAIDYNTAITSSEISTALKTMSDKIAAVDPNREEVVLWDALKRFENSADNL